MIRGAALLALVIAVAACGREAHARLADPPADSVVLLREFPVLHQNAEALAKVLWPLGSGDDGTFVEGHRKRRLLRARDHDAHLTAIEVALRGLDVPSAPRPEIDVAVRLLVVTKEPGPKMSPELTRVLAPIRRQFKASGLVEIAAPDDRIEQGEGKKREGRIERGPDFAMRARWSLRLEDVKWRAPAGAGKLGTVSIGRFRVWTEGEGYGEAEFGTSLSAREGEPVVVGVVPLKGTTLVVVLEARRAK